MLFENMAKDVLASRREARRLRILQNSESRLQKITDTSKDSLLPLENEDTSAVTQNGSYSHELKNGSVLDTSSVAQVLGDGCNLFQHATRSLDSYNVESRPSLHQEENSDVVNEDKIQQLEGTRSKSFGLHILYSAKLHLILLAILMKAMLTSSVGFIFGECLLTPFCMVEVTDVLISQLNKEKTVSSLGMFGVALLFSGIPQTRVTTILHCFEILKKIGQDTCVYLFTFVTFHALLLCQEEY